MMASRLGTVLCTVYVSEAAKVGFINSLKSKVSSSLVHSFPDKEYNRTSFYLMSKSFSSLEDDAMLLCTEATLSLNYTDHLGTHPSLGVIDNIVFSPLGYEGIETAKRCALSFAERLQRNVDVPVFLYGAASPRKMMLRDIRKKLGYFSKTDFDVSFEADMGSMSVVKPTLGVSCVGAVPMIINLNMRFRPEDKRADVAKVSKAVREPGLVESLTLDHAGGAYEVACNLRNTRTRSVEDVL